MRCLRRACYLTLLVGCGPVCLLAGCRGLPTAGSPVPDVSPQRTQRQQLAIAAFERQRNEAEYTAALARLRRGDVAQGREMLERLVTRAPEHAAARLRLAELELAERRYDEALTHLDQLLASQPDDAAVQHTMGLLLEAEGQLEGAVAYFRRAAELDPENAVYAIDYETASQWVATSGSDSGSTARTVSHVSQPAASSSGTSQRVPAASRPPAGPRVIEIGPASPIPARERRSLADRRGDGCPHCQGGRAIGSMGTTPAVQPGGLGARNEGESPVFSATVDRPAESHSAATALHAAWLLQAEHLMRSGAPQSAVRRVQLAMAADPDNADIPLRAAALFIERNEPDAAITLLRGPLMRFPDRAALRRLFAVALYRAGSYDEAVAELRRAVSLDKSDALSYFLLGIALDKVGRPAEAAENYRVASRLDPSLPPAR